MPAKTMRVLIDMNFVPGCHIHYAILELTEKDLDTLDRVAHHAALWGNVYGSRVATTLVSSVGLNWGVPCYGYDILNSIHRLPAKTSEPLLDVLSEYGHVVLPDKLTIQATECRVDFSELELRGLGENCKPYLVVRAAEKHVDETAESCQPVPLETLRTAWNTRKTRSKLQRGKDRKTFGGRDMKKLGEKFLQSLKPVSVQPKPKKGKTCSRPKQKRK